LNPHLYKCSFNLYSLNYWRTYSWKVIRTQVVSISKFLSQLYITTQPRRAISSWRLFQRFNPSRVVLRTNTCRAENLITHLRRVVRANRNINPSEVHSTSIVSQREVLVIPEVRDYVTLVVCQNSLTNFSSISIPTLIVSKCSNIIPCKFKAVKFTSK